MSETGIAVGTAELMLPDARRDALRGLLIDMLPMEAPSAVHALAALFDQHGAFFREFVRRALVVDVTTDERGGRHAAFRETEWARLAAWATVRGLVDGKLASVEVPAEELEALRPRFVAAVNDIRQWASHHGLAHDFLAGSAWQTLLSWAQNDLLPRDRLNNASYATHLVAAAALDIPLLQPPAYNPALETREAYRRRLPEYMAAVERAARERYPHLMRRPKKGIEQVQWYIRYQVLNWSCAQIAKEAKGQRIRKDTFDEETVLRAIARFRRSAGLKDVARASARGSRRRIKPDK